MSVKEESPKNLTIELKSAEEYLKQEKTNSGNDEYIKQLQAEAKEIYKTRGALCDSEGFYQHTGECWSDAFQQVLLNADTLKEYIQYDLIHTYYSLDYEIPGEFFAPEEKDEYEKAIWVNENDELIQKKRIWFLLYVREIQKRFLRHYLTETKRRVFKETCSSNEEELGYVARQQFTSISKSKGARVSGREGQKIAIFGKVTPIKEYPLVYTNTSRPSLESYKKESDELAGGTQSDFLVLLHIFNKLIFLNQLKYKEYKSNALRIATVTSQLYPEAFDNAKGIVAGLVSVDNSAHEIGFYECGKKQYMYDNNYGIFPFPWRDLFKYALTKNIQFQNLRIEFCEFMYTNEEKKIYFKTNTYPILQYYTVTYGENNQSTIQYHTLFFFKNEEMRNINDGNSGESFSFEKILNKNEKIKLTYSFKDAFELGDFILLHKEFYEGENISNVGTEINIRARIQRNALLYAINRKNEAKALQLIDDLPVEPELVYVSKNGDIPVVMLALFVELPKVAIKLIDKGYNINVSYDNHTPLMMSIYKDYIEVAAHLVSKKVNVEMRDEFGKQAIHFAAFEKSPVFVKLLVEYTNANINALTAIGRTPLFFASREGNIEVVQYLCKKGADPTIKDLGDTVRNMPPQTAMDVAATEEIKEVLRNCSQQGGGKYSQRKSIQTRRHSGKTKSKHKKTRRHL